MSCHVPIPCPAERDAGYPSSIEILVTAEHIARGVRRSCTHCPIALAAADALPPREGDFVAATEYLTYGRISYLLPYEADDWRVDFDEGHIVGPFEFKAWRMK